MAAEAKANGKSLLDEMNEIYAECGYYRDPLDSFTLKGVDGLEKISYMMTELREAGSPFAGALSVAGYSKPCRCRRRF